MGRGTTIALLPLLRNSRISLVLSPLQVATDKQFSHFCVSLDVHRMTVRSLTGGGEPAKLRPLGSSSMCQHVSLRSQHNRR